MPGSEDLTVDQLAELLKAIESQLYYVAKLKLRMEALHWPHEDPLLVKTRLAQEALASLRMNLHYRHIDAKRDQTNK